MVRPFLLTVLLLSVHIPSSISSASLTQLSNPLNYRAQSITAYRLAPCPRPMVSLVTDEPPPHLTSILPINSSGLLLSQVVKVAAMSCQLSAIHRGVSLQEPLFWTCKMPLSNKPLMSLSLSSSSFFGLEARQLHGFQLCRMQPNTWTYYYCSD